EGQRLLSRIPDGAYVIALAIEGESMSSVQLARRLESLTSSGESHIVFVIGGSLGLSPEVMGRSDMQLSFSKMTFPHQLMRVILLEQIYRSFRIIRGEPYHK
ncbi:MAG: 23S rRNA (pseudouridine(1915)-N(3))-methyltransferase RlmH, partial [Lachnospiraceae bacterium]|nr:23S rRNA (pseudouridine(1915)-N(3))-methyltransferase RlmH [Lachnospiraceae bacterium]